MELILLCGIFLMILGIGLVFVGVSMLKRGDESGVIMVILSIIFFCLGCFISTNTVIETTTKNVKTTSLNYLVEIEHVGVEINPFGDIQYELLDSTHVDLFNYLMKEIKQDYPKKINKE